MSSCLPADPPTTDDEVRRAMIIAIMPKCIGFLSMFCSGFVINHICLTPGQLSKVTNRLLLALSCADMLYTFIMPFMSSWLVPKDLCDVNGKEVFVYMNTGNEHTCSMQGFLDQFSSKCSWTYNAVLAFSYFIAVRFRQGEKTLVRYEKLLHGVPIVSALLAAIIPLPYQAYNHAGGAFCWIAASPSGCEKEDDNCVRGEHFRNLRLWLSFIPIFVTQAVVLLSMLGVFLTVFNVERKTARYGAPTASGGSAARRNGARSVRALKRSKKVALKCALYVMAFEITWFFNVWGVVQFLINPENDHETKGPTAGGWITTKYMLNLAFLSSYGIWSSIAYFLLPFLKVRKAQPEWSFFDQVKRTVLPPPKMGSPGMRNANRRAPWVGRTSHHISSASPSNVLSEPQKTYFEEEDDFGHDDDDDDDDDKCDNNNISGDEEAGDVRGESETAYGEHRETTMEAEMARPPKSVRFSAEESSSQSQN